MVIVLRTLRARQLLARQEFLSDPRFPHYHPIYSHNSFQYRILLFPVNFQPCVIVDLIRPFIMTFIRTMLFSTLALTGACRTMHRNASSPIEIRSSWTHQGCYTDNVSGRALPNGEAVPGGTDAMTNELCQAACEAAGFSIAGTEYAGECCKYQFVLTFARLC